MFEFSLHEFRSAIDVIVYWERHYSNGPPVQEPRNALAASIAGIMLDPPIPAEEIDMQKRLLGLLRGTCQRLESEAAVHRLDRIEQSHKYPGLLAWPKAHQDWKALREALDDDIKNRYIQYVPRGHAELLLRVDQDWRVATEKFQAASEDILRAAECYALGQPTACVFHLMRAMEVAVKKLASRLKINVHPKDTWGLIVGRMTPKIAAMKDDTPARKRKKDAWSEATANLHHVGQATRNGTMHPRKTYTTQQGREVYESVRVFMTGLATL